ncbi:apolipoprotein N-acyltransferase [Novosphingobium album (ex Hu et al. 2023)]|uniref:Apolipoprotein N-acyltransferase n=1 Tax=Novosphingobium album (ex Hu et al. 2023) TaxID=2930093 RepID=A0ABT0B2K1_9SPHN|nr:apolipoprotein N-acyltransferase [Novosphingobium album (ex Hu et al. 2023)]MCJ2179286.1 apolipoprotein N-acyltransferase [Novosphingobium album (ex Hu et al. 2023)]
MQSLRRPMPFLKIPKTLERPRLTVAVAATGSGALAACGFQPLSLWPLTLLAVAFLIELVMRARTGRGAFLIGWYFGLGHFTLGNNWIATAFTYQANMPVWLGAIAVALLSLYLAVFPALATLAAWLLARPDRARTPFSAFVLAFGSAWIITEWMRAWVFTGFAWNPLGIALLGQFQTRGLALLTPWIGTYGLSGVLVLLAGVPGLFARPGARAAGAKRWLWAIPVLAAAAALGTLMTVSDPWVRREEGAVRFTLIQPDLRQEIIDDPRWYEASFQKMARLSLSRDPGQKRMVFWPESGLGDYLRDGYPLYLYRLYTYAADPEIARARIGRVIGPYGLLLTGAVDLVMKDGDAIAARNSVTAIDGRGSILAGYSKAHLVPYGEYLPMRWLLEPLGASRLVAGALDFWPGPGARTYDFGTWGKAGIQICYEIVFSGEVVDPLNRPDYIYNPSNDGWFGTWGPPQHLAQARLRAIEEGLPILRSTTTGISAVIDADGLVRNAVAYHTAGRIDGRIPPPHEPTAFARHGNALPLALAGILFLACLSVVALNRHRG